MALTLSVIVSAYNRESTIGRTLASIKAQSYPHIEVVCIDAASTDNTYKVAEKFLSDSDVLYSGADTGIYDGFNKGISKATGDVVCFLHSDDFFHDNNVVLDIMQILQKTNANVVSADVSFFSQQQPDKITRKYRSARLNLRNLAWGIMPAHPGLFIKAEIYQQIGSFNQSFKIAGDFEFCCRLAKYPALKVEKIDRFVIKMQTGGISTAGIRSKFIINKEVLRALRMNSIYSNIFMILTKYPRKLLSKWL